MRPSVELSNPKERYLSSQTLREAVRSDGSPKVTSSGSTAARAGWTFAGLVSGAGSQWLIIVLLARLGPTSVGQYTLGLAVCAPIIGLASLALRTVLITETEKSFNFADYVRLRIGLMGVALIAIVAISTTFYPSTVIVIVLVGAAKAIDSVGDVFTGLFQRYEQMQFAALGMISNAVFSIGIATLLLIGTSDGRWTVVGSAAGSLVGSVAFPLAVVHRYGFRIRQHACRPDQDRPPQFRRLIRLIRTSAPLGVALGVASFSVNLPRLFVDAYLGHAALGIFAVASYVVVAANMCFTAIAQTMMPRMARVAEQGDLARLTKMVSRLATTSVSCGILGLALYTMLGRWLIQAVYGQNYVTGMPILATFGIAAVASGPPIFLGAYLSSIRIFDGQAAVSIVTLLATLIASAFLVRYWGLMGAGLSTITATATETVAKLITLRVALRGRSMR